MRGIVVASVGNAAFFDGAAIRELEGRAQWLEVRAGADGDVNADWIRGRFSGPILYTLDGCGENRSDRLAEAARVYDFVTLQSDYDLHDSVLSKVPPSKRILRWSGRAETVTKLDGVLRELIQSKARYYRIAPQAANSAEAVAVLAFLASSGRDDVVAYAGGRTGHWTRLLSFLMGSPLLFAWTGESVGPDGEPPVWLLREHYGIPGRGRPRELYGIAANPAFHSLSPLIHNASHESLGSDGIFVPFEVDAFESFWRGLVESRALEQAGVTVRGLTVASPFKELALEHVELASSTAKCAESANIAVLRDGCWFADTTDFEGVRMCLAEAGIKARGRRAAVVGCGGAGRAAAMALSHAGAFVTLVNRGQSRGVHASELLGLPFRPLAEFSPQGFDILVNATPVGRDDHQIPFRASHVPAGAAIIDFAYGTEPTPLVSALRNKDHIVIDGREVLRAEVQCQFRLMTGREMPAGLAEDLLARERGLSQTACASS